MQEPLKLAHTRDSQGRLIFPPKEDNLLSAVW